MPPNELVCPVCLGALADPWFVEHLQTAHRLPGDVALELAEVSLPADRGLEGAIGRMLERISKLLDYPGELKNGVFDDVSPLARETALEVWAEEFGALTEQAAVVARWLAAARGPEGLADLELDEAWQRARDKVREAAAGEDEESEPDDDEG